MADCSWHPLQVTDGNHERDWPQSGERCVLRSFPACNSRTCRPVTGAARRCRRQLLAQPGQQAAAGPQRHLPLRQLHALRGMRLRRRVRLHHRRALQPARRAHHHAGHRGDQRPREAEVLLVQLRCGALLAPCASCGCAASAHQIAGCLKDSCVLPACRSYPLPDVHDRGALPHWHPPVPVRSPLSPLACHCCRHASYEFCAICRRFIAADLAAVNRAVTPWIVATAHRPVRFSVAAF